MKKTRNSVISLCTYVNKDMCKKREPKFTINKGQKLHIKRTISKLKERKNKVNATKIKNECDLNISVSTIQKHMKRIGMKYKKISSHMYLSHKHKEDRLTKVSSWVTENHVCDEKRFSLDGPGDWHTYFSEYEDISRQQRQCGGGSIMVYRLLSYEIINKKFNSEADIVMLRTSIVPIL